MPEGAFSPENLIKQTRAVGEAAAIRRVNSADKMDITKMLEVWRSRDVKEYIVGGEDSFKRGELKSWVKGGKYKEIYAVSGSQKVEGDDKGEIQGWVVVDGTSGERERAERGLGRKLGDELPVLEVAFAKHPDAPAGQIASAVRQVCLLISQRDAQNAPIGEVQPKRLVTAFVEPDNEASIRVLEKCGFVRQEKMVSYFPEDAEDTESLDLFYLLDWQKLHDIVHGKSGELFDGFQNR